MWFEQRITKYKCNFFVGTDGMKPRVFEWLTRHDISFSSWKNSKSQGFRVKHWHSPSSDLVFITLHINPNARVLIGDGTSFQLPFANPVFYVIRCVFKKTHKVISLGLLPSRKAPASILNVIRVPEHDIWKLRNSQE